MKVLIFVLAVTSISAFASDIRINIKNSGPDYKILKATAVYQTTKDSFFCKKTSWVDGALQRNPILSEDSIMPQLAGNQASFTIVVEKKDKCLNKLVGLSIEISHPKLFSNSRIQFMDVNEPTGNLDQKVEHKVYTSPVTGKEQMTQSKSLLLGTDNEVNAEVVIE